MTIPTFQALALDVLRNAAETIDCTRRGVTSTHTQLHLVGHIPEGTREIVPLSNGARMNLDSDDAPVALQVRRVFSTNPVVSLVPLEWDGDTLTHRPGTMMGGNYATTSDSRVSELVSDLLGFRFYGAIAVHDRRED